MKASVAFAAAFHVTSLACFCAGVGIGDNGFGLLGLMLWCGSALVAAVAGILTLRRWSLLSGWWIALGLLLWIVVASELALPILLLVLYGL